MVGVYSTSDHDVMCTGANGFCACGISYESGITQSTMNVESGTKYVAFLVRLFESSESIPKTTITITMPDGTVINSQTSIDGVVKILNSNGLIGCNIANPQSGTWTIQINPQENEQWALTCGCPPTTDGQQTVEDALSHLTPAQNQFLQNAYGFSNTELLSTDNSVGCWACWLIVWAFIIWASAEGVAALAALGEGDAIIVALARSLGLPARTVLYWVKRLTTILLKVVNSAVNWLCKQIGACS